MAIEWVWIPITLWAAFAQTLRNTAQRRLIKELGTLGATLVRFLYGLPFALLWFAILASWNQEARPQWNGGFVAWVVFGAVCQIGGTAFLLRAMEARSFAIGVAYSKTEIIQVALFGLLFLGDPLGIATLLAVLLSTVGVLLLAPADPQRPVAALFGGWTSSAARYGLASGAGFALASVGFRGAILALEHRSFLFAAANALVLSLAVQTVLLGGYLLLRKPTVVRGVLNAWRPSLFAGFMGAAASAGWFSAFALEPAAHVRTLGLIELVFSYAVSLRLFRERFTQMEFIGMLLLMTGLLLVTLRA